MPGGDHCAVWGCDNDHRRYPEKQKVLPHVEILRFYSPKNNKDVLSWARAINRDQFKVTTSTKVCSNHFVQGYRTSQCPTPTLYMKGYDCDSKPQRPAPKFRSTENKERKPTIRKRSYSTDQGPSENLPLEEESLLEENFDFEYPASLSPASTAHSTDAVSKIEVATQSIEVQRKRKEIISLTKQLAPKTGTVIKGVTRFKLDLLFEFLEPKATNIRIWRGSKNTKKSSKKRATEGKKTTNTNDGVLTKWEQFVLTLVRTRKGFDVKFLADTLGINPSQVPRIYNTWVTFLSQELSFLVPWPSRSELRKSLPKRFKNFKNVRIIIDCLELFIQKPKVSASQKMTWSSYKHWNTATLLVGITPTGVVSFIPHCGQAQLVTKKF
ncbi:uncharacterized protein [Montipora capricornis]|uniref:uncharacterized protein n=1 Tax=Montipora capricornis TaxID=246305 RepID=UPI0035F13F74